MPNASQLKQLGEVIREARQRKGWTLVQLSDTSGVGYSYCSNIERGYVNPTRGPVTPSDDILYSLASALEIPVARLHGLLGRDGNDADDHEVIDYLRGKPEPIQDKALRLLKAAFDEDDAEDDAGNIGKKAE